MGASRPGDPMFSLKRVENPMGKGSRLFQEELRIPWEKVRDYSKKSWNPISDARLVGLRVQYITKRSNHNLGKSSDLSLKWLKAFHKKVGSHLEAALVLLLKRVNILFILMGSWCLHRRWFDINPKKGEDHLANVRGLFWQSEWTSMKGVTNNLCQHYLRSK